MPFANPSVVNLANQDETWKFSSADVTGIVIAGGTGAEERQIDVLEIISDAPAGEASGLARQASAPWTATGR